MSIPQIMHNIKTNSFRWTMIANLVFPDNKNLWWINPKTALSLYSRMMLHQIMDYWFKMVDFKALVDGSWKRKNDIVSAIGGFLCNKEGKILFIF